MFVHVSDRDFVSPNFSEFIVECEWSSKISQKNQKMDFFGKIDGFFSKKNLELFSKSLNMANFLSNATQMVLLPKNVFPPRL